MLPFSLNIYFFLLFSFNRFFVFVTRADGKRAKPQPRGATMKRKTFGRTASSVTRRATSSVTAYRRRHLPRQRGRQGLNFLCLSKAAGRDIIFSVIEMDHIRNNKLTKRAQELRRKGTEQENRLWFGFLRKYPIRFRRQVTMHHFIVDFYCAKAKLILEIDGSQHYTEEGEAYDSERTAILESFGYKVLRITNNDVNHNFYNVCEWIYNEVKDRIYLLEQDIQKD